MLSEQLCAVAIRSAPSLVSTATATVIVVLVRDCGSVVFSAETTSLTFVCPSRAMDGLFYEGGFYSVRVVQV